MNRTMLFILMILASGQLYPQYYTKEEGNALMHELKLARTDSMRIELLLKVAEYHTLPGHDHPANYDTAALLINQVEDLNLKARSQSVDIRILMIQSFFLRTSGKRKEGENVIRHAITLLKNGTDYTALGKAYYELSNYYDYDFKYHTVNQRTSYIEMAIAAFKKSNQIDHLGNCYKVLADLHHLINEYPRALSEIETSLQYYKISNYKRLEGVYDLFGQLHYARGDYKKALDYELLALRTANSNNNTGMQICQIENNIALTFFKLNDAPAALKHFKIALGIAEKELHIETVYGLTSHIVETYINLNKPQEALRFLKSVEKKYKIPTTDKFETAGYMYKAYLNLYTVLKQFNTGRYYCNQLIMKSQVHGLDVFKRNGYYTEIIKYFTATNDYPVALKYLTKNKELLDSMKDGLGASRNYLLWFSLDTSLGNYKSAVHNLLKANHIADTILNTAKTKEIKQLEVQYESEKKENDINLKNQKITMLEQADKLRQANLDQAKFIRNATLAMLVLLLTLGSILLNQYRQKKKANIVVTQRNDQLKSLVKEKEWLVKEVHHRVKNNLQMVISLLNTQSVYLDNDVALLAIKDSQRRIHTMSLIHQKLYQSENISVIDMPGYINELVNYLKDIFNIGPGIRFQQNIEPCTLDVAQAVPVGLILNEVITNSVKYAFAPNNYGIITITMRALDNDTLGLIVSDNGRGLPAGFNVVKNGSLGMNLVNGLVKQHEGTFEILDNEGVTITMTFPFEKNMVIETENISAINAEILL